MKIFKVEGNEEIIEFPYELEHFCIVCAESEEQAKNLVLKENPKISELNVSKICTNTPHVIFHDFTDVD